MDRVADPNVLWRIGDWAALAVIYLALAAVMLGLVARFHVHEVFSLLLVAASMAWSTPH
jgi:hypothetical protein